MTARQRPFDPARDFEAIYALLARHYREGNRDGNWLAPVWEYGYTHPWFDEAAAEHIGVWEDGGEVVAAVTYELRLGEAFFHTHPDHARLKPAMLAHAERHLAADDDRGRRRLRVYVNDFDEEFSRLVSERGYVRAEAGHRPMSTLAIPDPFPPIQVPEGFRLQSLADENDLRKVDRVLHRGFNHEGEPPDDGLAGRRKMQSGPHYRPELTLVAVAPDGAYVSFAGLWYEPTGRYGYVEPVATDPDYRRRGLGTAAVLEGIRRCGRLGAKLAYVGTDKPFYLSFGFEKQFTTCCWQKCL